MEFGLVSVLLIIAAAAAIIGGLKLLFAKDYILQFLRGFVGLLLLLFAFVVTMSSLNLASYSQLVKGQAIANVSFTKTNDQRFMAVVVNVRSGEEREFELEGDMWQMDARIMRVLGAKTPFYMLERISGRYYSLEQQKTNPSSVYGLSDESVGFDLFKLFRHSHIDIIQALYGSATYLPMADGAAFVVSVTASGLTSKPVNAAASAIVEEWQ